MIAVECEQGSAEWLRARSAKQTASNFWLMRRSQRMTRGANAGDWSEKQRDLAWQLACERIAGGPLDEEMFQTWAMRRGHRLEPAARAEHEIQCGVIVERVGFVMTDDGRYGASLDGRIRPRGASEYKCLIGPQSLREVLEKHDPSRYMDQCQGGLWITGLDWIDLCVYAPFLSSIDKQLTVTRIYRDDDYITELEDDLNEFRLLIDSSEAKIRSLSSTTLVTQRPEAMRKIVTKTPAAAAIPPVAGLGLTETERFMSRVRASRSAPACALILDNAQFLLAADDYKLVYDEALKCFPGISA